MELKRVVVTGLGTINPIGNNIEEYWNNLINGVSGAAPITRFDATFHKTRFACEVKNWDPLVHFDRKDARKYDLFTQFALVSAKQAILDSKIDLDSIDKNRVGVIWGAGIGGIQTFEDEVMGFNTENPKTSPFFIPKMIANMASGCISIEYGFRGPNLTTVSACASSANALADALMYLRLGKADIIISGGSEAAITPAGVAGFNSLKAISTRNDDPKTASRPFDKDRDGFVMGEGAACLVLEEYEHAIARGATIYAEFAGAGLTADAYHMTAPDPDANGASTVMRLACEDAGISTDMIDYINVHGTSTGLGDIAEPSAIKKVFGPHAYQLNISSTKSMTGHLLGAAGAAEAIATILAIRDNIVPPTINHFETDPELDPEFDFTFNVAKKKEVNYALSNTFGFGGHNASVVFKKFK
ncbi:MAG TPA: beta-ketoacyl-ACP synthase II [Prolixibacteraceae bacterium]|nr:beta-ketoacyl-ACP synthase II [Prolixibacteraceae bacterium]HUM88583.1 beta-ketoacyl-ACP synthase II [Prolixibacteraceae bacterium]